MTLTPPLTPPLLYRGIKQHGDTDCLRQLNVIAQAQLWTELGKRYHSYSRSSKKKRRQCLYAVHTINNRLIKLADLPTTERHFMCLTNAVLALRDTDASFDQLIHTINHFHAILNHTQSHIPNSSVFSSTLPPSTGTEISITNQKANRHHALENTIAYDSQLLRLTSLSQLKQLQSESESQTNKITASVLLNYAKQLGSLRNTDKCRIYFHLLAQPTSLQTNPNADYFRQLPLVTCSRYLARLQQQLINQAGQASRFDTPSIHRLLTQVDSVFSATQPARKPLTTGRQRLDDTPTSTPPRHNSHH